jgi:hypothetical protein
MRSTLPPPVSLRSALPFLLSVLGCSGADETPGGGTQLNVAVQSELGDSELIRRVDAAAVLGDRFPSKADIESVAFQLPGRDLQEDPPRIASADVVSDPAGGSSRLEVTFAEGMPPRLKLLLDGRVSDLRDDGRDADRVEGDGVYAAWAPASWTELFETRGPRTAAEALRSPANRLRSGVFIDPARSLMITDLDVVNNGSRTSDPCTQLVTPSVANKPWTFGFLVTQMANTPVTNVSADAFVRGWLDSWRFATTINGDPVSPPVPSDATDRPNISVPEYLLRKWRLASRVRSDGTFDPNTNPALKMEKAPFRLLAIVPRFDLRRNNFFGEGSAGELRFVFGVLDLDGNTNLATDPREAFSRPCLALEGPSRNGGTDFRNSTVIFEYAVDKANEPEIIAWARAWVGLSGRDQSDPLYRSELQRLTDSVVKATLGRVKDRSNQSAIIRIRTNEAPSGAGPWHLREFAIPGARDSQGRLTYTNGKLNCGNSACVPRPATVKQTPADRHNGTRELVQWVLANESLILQENHKVPDLLPGGIRFLGGRAINPPGVVWGGPSLEGDVRHLFSLNTCNGCHSLETGTHFAHIESREFDAEARLSEFLMGAGQGNPLEVPDPVSGELRTFNEVEMRSADLRALDSGHVFPVMSFRSTTRTH